MAVRQHLRRIIGGSFLSFFKELSILKLFTLSVFVLTFSPIFFLMHLASPVHAAGPTIALYKVGDHGQDVVASISRALEAKGYPVILVQGEMTVEKHIEKANILNRSLAKLLIAFQFIPSDKSRRVTVVKTLSKKGEGNFLTIDEVPGKFADESNRFAYAVADSFTVKVKQMPLFPLLGVNMPGFFLRLEGKETDLGDFTSRLCSGLEIFIKKDKNL
jgi:hypothetical protein